jgi:hypothetical protein
MYGKLAFFVFIKKGVIFWGVHWKQPQSLGMKKETSILEILRLWGGYQNTVLKWTVNEGSGDDLEIFGGRVTRKASLMRIP